MMIEIMRECQKGHLWLSKLSIIEAAIGGNHVSNFDDIIQKIMLTDVLL
jgi:hypothetical protein